MRLFLDANVLFSAALSADGNARALFRLAPSARAELWSSRFALDEARRNLRAKAADSESELDRLLPALRFAGEPAAAAVAAAGRTGLPAKDAPILAAAVAVGATALVTGDRRHFGSLFGTIFDGTAVELPGTAVERLLLEIERRGRASRRR